MKHSSGLAELSAFCEALTWPATEYDRRTFEALYRHVLPKLSAREKGEAEWLALMTFTDEKSTQGQVHLVNHVGYR